MFKASTVVKSSSFKLAFILNLFLSCLTIAEGKKGTSPSSDPPIADSLAVQAVIDFLSNNIETYHINDPVNELKIDSIMLIGTNMVGISYSQFYCNLRVVDGVLKAIVDTEGDVRIFKNGYKIVAGLNPTPNCTAEEAKMIAENHLAGYQAAGECSEPELVIKTGKFTVDLCWFMTAFCPTYYSNWIYYVDAIGGGVLEFQYIRNPFNRSDLVQLSDSMAIAALADKAYDYLDYYKLEYNMNDPKTELRLEQVNKGDLGYHEIIFNQVWNNVPVYGKSTRVFITPKGKIADVLADYLVIEDFDVTPVITGDEVNGMIMDRFGDSLGTMPQVAQELVVYPGSDGPIPVWLLIFGDRYSRISQWRFFVNAKTQEIICYNTFEGFFNRCEPAKSRVFSAPLKKALEIVTAFMERNKEDYGISNLAEQLKVGRVDIGRGGHMSVRFDQIHNGLDVWSGSLMVTTYPSGAVRDIMDRLIRNISVDHHPKISPQEAQEIARKNFSSHCQNANAGQPILFYYIDTKNAPVHLCWRFSLGCPGDLETWKYFIEAMTGDIIGCHSSIQH